MDFPEYLQTVLAVPVSDRMEFSYPFFWLHPGELPLSLHSLGGETMPVLRIPDAAVNKRSNMIKHVIAFSPAVFQKQEQITDLILPSTVQRFHPYSFAGCKNLRNLTIPRRIRKIPEHTFDGCIRLENIYYEGTPEEWAKVEIICQKHEIRFAAANDGTPVDRIFSEKLVHIPGNEAVFSANIHFGCAVPLLPAAGLSQKREMLR